MCRHYDDDFLGDNDSPGSHAGLQWSAPHQRRLVAGSHYTSACADTHFLGDLVICTKTKHL